MTKWFSCLLFIAFLLFPRAVLEGQTAIDLEIRAYDVIELNNGNQFEGRIIAELSNLIQFETAAGKVTFPLSDVRNIFYRNPPEKVYQTRLQDGFDESSAAEQFEIGRWCLDPAVGLLEQAVNHLEMAVQLDPTSAAPYQLLIPIYQQDDARQFQSTDHEMTADVAMTQTLLKGVRANIEIEGLFELTVTQLIQIGESEAAVLLLMRQSEGDVTIPSVAAALKKLVVLLDALGRSEESRQAASRLRKGGGGSDVEVLQREIRWAVLDYAAGSLDSRDAIEQLFDDLIAAGGADGQSYLYRGTARLLDDQLVLAQDDFKKAFRAGSVDAIAATTFALSFARMGDFDKALGLLGPASEGDQVNVDWRLVEAYVLESQGESRAAVDLYQEATEQAEATWQSRLLSIEARRRLDPNWDPTSDVEKVMRHDVLSSAAFAECALVLGDHALSRGKQAEARRWLEYAVASGLDGSDVMLRLGLAQRGPGGDPKRARDALTLVTIDQPKNPDGWNALAEFLHSNGELEDARLALRKSLDLFPEKMRDNWAPDAPAPLRWALRAQRRINRTLSEEYWYDDFDRANDSSLQNNWREEEAFGVSVSLKDGMAIIEGVQKHQPDRLTSMKREILTSRLTGFRSTLRLLAAGTGTRIAFRVEDQSGGGLIFFRDPDGVLGFALLGGKEIKMVRSDDAEQGEDFGLIETIWSPDDRAHQLEIIFTREGKEGAELWFDGILVAREIPYRPARKAGLTAGFSGQAPLDEKYHLAIEEFEVFRRKAVSIREQEY
ncbi:MAG: tetratricopeptide repeat protein [Planctomycetota bacterium]|nr:tetratricopeptide repeat protein [Planctomycetota bacterium]